MKLFSWLVLAGLAGALATGQPTPKHVAIVIDDGPVPANAVRFLELFETEGVQVSWAYEARDVQQFPETAQAATAAGHEIVNHSFDHLHPRDLDDDALHHEIVDAQAVLAEFSGQTPKWYWRPFGEVDPRQEALWEEAGIKDQDFAFVVTSNDWNSAVDADQIYSDATSYVPDGCIILFHEWRQETVDLMPSIIAELKRQGCVFLTFSKLAHYLEHKQDINN